MSAIDVYLEPTTVRPWTTAEEDFLREHYALRSTDEIAATLDRSHSAIYNRLFRLGLTRENVVAARSVRDQAETRRVTILLAYRLQAVGAEEAAVALGVPVGRLAIELGKAAARGQALVAAALEER